MTHPSMMPVIAMVTLAAVRRVIMPGLEPTRVMDAVTASMQNG